MLKLRFQSICTCFVIWGLVLQNARKWLSHFPSKLIGRKLSFQLTEMMLFCSEKTIQIKRNKTGPNPSDRKKWAFYDFLKYCTAIFYDFWTYFFNDKSKITFSKLLHLFWIHMKNPSTTLLKKQSKPKDKHWKNSNCCWPKFHR